MKRPNEHPAAHSMRPCDVRNMSDKDMCDIKNNVEFDSRPAGFLHEFGERRRAGRVVLLCDPKASLYEWRPVPTTVTNTQGIPFELAQEHTGWATHTVADRPRVRFANPKKKSALWLWAKGQPWRSLVLRTFAFMPMPAAGLLAVWAYFQWGSFEATFLPLTDFSALNKRNTLAFILAPAALSWLPFAIATTSRMERKTWRDAKREANDG